MNTKHQQKQKQHEQEELNFICLDAKITDLLHEIAHRSIYSREDCRRD
jgi:hypothetical protein